MAKNLFSKKSIINMVLISILGLISIPAQGEGIVFTDVSKDFWSYSSIAWATEQKIVEGYPDGTFKPEQSVTQTEFIAMLVRAYLNKDQLPDGDSSHWGAPYIKHAYNMGWASSIVVPPSSKLNSDFNNVSESRKYVAKLITNASGKNYDFDDSIRFVLESGLAEGKTDKSVGGFKGNDLVTRAEAVTFIQRLRQKYNQLQSSPMTEEKYVPQNIFYEDTLFTLKLPVSWEGRYEVDNQVFNVGNNTTFINKATKGILFAVTTEFKDHWSTHGQDIIDAIGSHLTQVGEKDDRVYLITTPTDVEYDPSDEKSKMDYLSMSDDVKSIISTFEFKNDLASSQNSIHSISRNLPEITILNDSHEIPSLKGTYCWGGCVDKSDASTEIKDHQYNPVIVNANSVIILKFADYLQPAILKASKVNGLLPKIEDVDIKKNQITVPNELGTYIYDVEVIWTYKDGTTAGSAGYFFSVLVE